MRPEDIYALFGFYEKDRCFSVQRDYWHVACAHPAPVNFRFDIESRIAVDRLQRTDVELKKYVIKEGRSGCAGKCEICGKVYYWD